MRGLIPTLLSLALLAGPPLGCPGPAEPSRPAPRTRPRPPATQPRERPRARPPVRKAPRPRPRRWSKQLLGRAAAGGPVTRLAAAGPALVSVTRERGGTWLKGWDASTRKVTWTLKAPARMVELSLSADGRSLLVTTPGGTNHVYRLGSGAPKRYRSWKRKRGRNKGRTQGLSAKGTMLIRGDVRGQVRGYTLDKYKMKWLVKGDRVAVSTDGKVAAVLRGAELRVVHAVTGQTQGSASTYDKTPVAVAPHSRGRVAAVLMTGQPPHKCGLDGVGTRREVPCFKHLQLTWSPGGTRIAVAGQGGAMLIPRVRGHKTLSFATSSKTPVRVAYPSERTFVVANLRPGQLSFYRLVRR